MTMTGMDISAKQSVVFSSQKSLSRRHFGFESFAAEVEYKQTFGAMGFFAQGHHEDSVDVPSSHSSSGLYEEQRLPQKGNPEANIPSSDSSILACTAAIQVFQTDVQRCNSQLCLACRPSCFDRTTRFLRVPKVTPEDIPKLPSKWWSEQSYDSSWVDRFWTSMTKIMDGEACGPVKYCGGESTKCKKSSSVPQYEREKH